VAEFKGEDEEDALAGRWREGMRLILTVEAAGLESGLAMRAKPRNAEAWESKVRKMPEYREMASGEKPRMMNVGRKARAYAGVAMAANIRHRLKETLHRFRVHLVRKVTSPCSAGTRGIGVTVIKQDSPRGQDPRCTASGLDQEPELRAPAMAASPTLHELPVVKGCGGLHGQVSFQGPP